MVAISIPQVRRDYVAGVLGIVISVFLMALQDALVKATSSSIGLWQLFTLRALVAVPVVYVIARASVGRGNVLHVLLDPWVMARSGLLISMYVSLYAVIPFVPLSTLAAGFYTGPIFIVIFSAIASGDPVRVVDRFAIAVGFIGVLMISRPTAGGINALSFLPVLSGIFYAGAAVMTREKLHDKTPLSLSLSLNVSLGAVGLIMTGIVWAFDFSGVIGLPHMIDGWYSLSIRDLGVIALLGVLLVAISVSLAFAYRSAPSPVVAGFDYSYLIFSGLFGFFFFNEVPTITSVFGMLLIAGAGLAMLKR